MTAAEMLAEDGDAGRRLDRGTLTRLLREVTRHRGTLAGAILLMLLSTAATLLGPRIFGYAVDEAIVPRNLDALKRITIVFLLAECVRVAATIANQYLFEVLGQRTMQDLRTRLFRHLTALPASDFDRQPVGRLVTRVTNDIAALAEMFSAGFIALAGNALVVIGILAWLLFLDPRLGLISAATFPLLIVTTMYFSGRLRDAYRLSRNRLSALNAFLAENLNGIRVVQLFGREAIHRGRFAEVSQQYADAQISTVRVFALFQPTITVASGFAMALVVWKGGNLAADGTLKLGVLVAYFSYVLSLFQPVREIADKWNVFLSGMTAAERVYAMLDWKTEVDPATLDRPARPAPGVLGRVAFENVWFAYEGENWVLRDFSLEIEAGRTLGVVGHTGAGKTTLISLLMRFYEPQRGRILLDGKDLRDYDLRALRASVGIIQQDVFLFSGSAQDNVFLWREPSASARAAVERLPLAGRLLDRVRDLQERGGNLSMGERQVLAFARALAIEPPLWILDEATANVDSESERLLSEALAIARGTRIIIAHRLATVRDADAIVVLHRGAILEKGSHSELMAGNGLYARLYRYQAAESASG